MSFADTGFETRRLSSAVFFRDIGFALRDILSLSVVTERDVGR
jgi:hypothetical protein